MNLSQAQFEQIELNVRRRVATCFDPEEMRILDYFVERSFRKGRTAAYFRVFRELGAATETTSHAHEALKRLVEKRVLVRLPCRMEGSQKKAPGRRSAPRA